MSSWSSWPAYANRLVTVTVVTTFSLLKKGKNISTLCGCISVQQSRSCWLYLDMTKVVLMSWYCLDVLILSRCLDIVSMSWYCLDVLILSRCLDIVSMSWYCLDVLILSRCLDIVSMSWYCLDVLILSRCLDIVSMPWYCLDVLILSRCLDIVSMSWYCLDALILSRCLDIVSMPWYCLYICIIWSISWYFLPSVVKMSRFWCVFLWHGRRGSPHKYRPPTRHKIRKSHQIW